MQMTSAMSLDSRSIRVKTAYKIEVLKNDQWIDSTALIIRGNDVYFAGTHVERFLYNEAVNSAAMTFNIHGQSCHANLFFTDAKQGFIGRYWDEQGNSLLIRGSLGYTELFLTKKRPLSDPRAGLESWLSFGIETHWDDFGGKNPTLVVKYTLGDYDVSNRTRVTHVDKAEGTTTIEMVKALLPFQMTFDDEIDDTSFTIVLQPGGEEFAGELNLQDELFELTGQLEDPAAQIQSSKLAAMAGAGEPGSVAAGSIQTPEMFYSTPTMSIQQLDSVSSIQRGKGENGAEYTYDAAQAGAGEYFNESLINGLDDEWVTTGTRLFFRKTRCSAPANSFIPISRTPIATRRRWKVSAPTPWRRAGKT
jgi:hypothetical protein